MSPSHFVTFTTALLAVLAIVTSQKTPGPKPSGSCTNTTGLPCPHVCPCYEKRAPEDCFSFDEIGNPLPCPQIDSNVTLAMARNETSEAMVFTATSIMGTCSRYVKYLDTWARLTDATKQKIKTFLSNPVDPSITYQDVEKMPIEAFAAANATLWREVMSKASDRQKLAIQIKVLMSKDCEIQSMLKGLNFTKLYQASAAKSEVNSSIFGEDLCRALLRNCSHLSADVSRLIDSTAPTCYSHVSEDCSKSKDAKMGNATGLPCPKECPCYQDKGTGDSLSFDEMGNPLPCPKIDMNVTLSKARNETSEAGVFTATSVMGTCSRYAEYLDTWARLTDAMKQKIKTFLSNPVDPSITYQDVEKMPIEAFAAANKTLWREIMTKASDRKKLAIQIKILMSNDCEVESMLRGLNFTQLYLNSAAKSEVDSSIFDEKLCRAVLRNCSHLSPGMSGFINSTASACLPYVSQNCTQSRDRFMPIGNTTRDQSMSMPTKDPLKSMPTKNSSMSMPTKDPFMSMPTKDPSMTMPTKNQSMPMPTKDPSMSMPTKNPSMPTRSPVSLPGGSVSVPARSSPNIPKLSSTTSSRGGITQAPGYTPKQFSGCDPGVEGLQCPRNCSNCYSNKKSTDCYSYDKFGNFLGCQSFSKNTTMMKALNETSDAQVFHATAEIGTCSRLAKYLRKWISLSDSSKEKAIRFLKDPKAVSDDDVKRLPIDIFAVANTTLLDNVTRQASTDQKLYIATAASLTRSCQVQDHLISFNLEQTFKDAEQAGTVDSTYFNASLCKAYMAGQCDMPLSKWQFAVDHAQDCLLDKAVCLKDVTDETLENLLSIESMKKLCNKTNIDARSKTLFQSRLNSYLDNKAAFTCDDDFLILMNMCNLKPKYVTKFCSDAKVAQYTPNKEQSREWEIIKSEFLTTKQIDFSTMDKSTLSSYLPISKSTMKSLDTAVLTLAKEAVCTDNVLDDAKFTDEQKREVMDVLLQKGQLDKSTDKDCLLKYVPAEVADSLTDTELRTAYDQNKINVTKLTPPQAKRLLVLISGSLTSDTQIKDNADLLVRGGSTSLPSLKGKSAETKKAYIKSIKNQQQENKVNPSVVTAVVEASLDESDREGSFKTIASESSEDIMSFVPPDFITDMSPAEVQSLASWPDMKEVKLPKNLEKALMKKVQETGIELNDPAVVSNLVAVVGSAPKSLFNTIDTDNANCPSILSSVAESEAITAEKYEHVCKKLETCLTSSNVDLSDASSLSGNALACFNKTMLEGLQGSCSDITTKMCTTDFSLLDGKQRKSDIKEYVFECLGISNTITGSHINSMGSCAELLSDSDIPKMDLSAMEAVYNILSSKFTCLSKISVYIEKYVTLKGSSITTTDIVQLGGWAIHLQSNIFSTVTGICDTVSTIGNALKTRDAIKQELIEEGLFTECKEELDDIKKEIGEYIIAALEDCTSARRRKRNTATITCSQLNDMGSSMLSSLTTSQLSGIQDADFIQCVSLLGSPTDYSAEQKQALASVAKRATVYDSPSTWSSSTIQSLGSIVQGLTSEELDTMNFAYDDIAQLGAYSGWEDSQKTTIFGNWTKSSAIATISSSELRSLGHMICAMSTSQIQQIASAIYEASADKIGEVTSCSETQMVQFATLAKTAFGNVYNWTSVQITSVGVHIGGLSKTEIATLTEAQIDEILASHITLIPSTVFSGFTSTQLGTFSPAQAQATTATQRSTLDSSQMTALESAAGTTFSDSSGVDRAVQMSWLAVCMSVLVALFL